MGHCGFHRNISRLFSSVHEVKLLSVVRVGELVDCRAHGPTRASSGLSLSRAASCPPRKPPPTHQTHYQSSNLHNLFDNDQVLKHPTFNASIAQHFATMPGKIIPVTSSSHFSQLLSQSTYTIVDFYADWCGPCKAIAPVFQNLAEKETKPGKLQFVKVDVDSQQEVAKKYGVSAYVYPTSRAEPLPRHICE